MLVCYVLIIRICSDLVRFQPQKGNAGLFHYTAQRMRYLYYFSVQSLSAWPAIYPVKKSVD